MWVQAPLWLFFWPLLGALALLGRPGRAAWQIAAAVALLVVATPVWAATILTPAPGQQATAESSDNEASPIEEERDQEPAEPEPAADPPEAADDPVEEEPAEQPAESPAEESSSDEGPSDSVAADPVAGDLEVHFIDVGQADATLLVHNDVAVLVDAGHWQRSDVVPYLRDKGVERLDLVVITHPHADHIGQFDQVLDAFDVDEVWWSGSETTTQTFDRAVTALESSTAAYHEPRAGDRTTIGPLAFDILNPADGASLSDLHDASLSFTITYGEVTFVFTGDAESAAEQRMVNTARNRLAGDILQLGHHGSNTSTTASFLSAVDPAVAVYSASAGNQYGHPHAEVIERLQAADVETYGTDVHGHVLVSTDGTTWSVSTIRSGTVAATPSPDASEEGARSPPPPEEPEEPEDEPPPTSDSCGAGQVDINTAGFEQLQEIIHIGPDRAQQILDLRPFSSVDDMTRISGIAAGRLAAIKEQGVACAG